MVQAAPNTEKLDEYLNDIIQAVKAACNTASPHLRDDPAVVNHAIENCEELLDTVMEGHVDEWIA